MASTSGRSADGASKVQSKEPAPEPVPPDSMQGVEDNRTCRFANNKHPTNRVKITQATPKQKKVYPTASTISSEARYAGPERVKCSSKGNPARIVVPIDVATTSGSTQASSSYERSQPKLSNTTNADPGVVTYDSNKNTSGIAEAIDQPSSSGTQAQSNYGSVHPQPIYIGSDISERYYARPPYSNLRRYNNDTGYQFSSDNTYKHDPWTPRQCIPIYLNSSNNDRRRTEEFNENNTFEHMNVYLSIVNNNNDTVIYPLMYRDGGFHLPESQHSSYIFIKNGNSIVSPIHKFHSNPMNNQRQNLSFNVPPPNLYYTPSHFIHPFPRENCYTGAPLQVRNPSYTRQHFRPPNTYCAVPRFQLRYPTYTDHSPQTGNPCTYTVPPVEPENPVYSVPLIQTQNPTYVDSPFQSVQSHSNMVSPFQPQNSSYNESPFEPQNHSATVPPNQNYSCFVCDAHRQNYYRVPPFQYQDRYTEPFQGQNLYQPRNPSHILPPYQTQNLSYIVSPSRDTNTVPTTLSTIDITTMPPPPLPRNTSLTREPQHYESALPPSRSELIVPPDDSEERQSSDLYPINYNNPLSLFAYAPLIPGASSMYFNTLAEQSSNMDQNSGIPLVPRDRLPEILPENFQYQLWPTDSTPDRCRKSDK